MRRTWVGVLTGMLVVLSGASVRADLPPPDGQKFVDYGFRVENLKSFSEYVLLAYPCSTTDGRPMMEHAVVSDGLTVSVGRRGGDPHLYAMKASDYAAWKATYKPAADQWDDPELKKLFESNRVVKCEGKPTPTFQLAKEDPRKSVLETLRAEQIDGSKCRITVLGSAQKAADTASNTTNPQNSPNTPDTPTKAGTTTAQGTGDPPTSSPPSGRGCAGCSVPESDSKDRPWTVLGALGAFVALIAGRRLSGTSARSGRRTSAR